MFFSSAFLLSFIQKSIHFSLRHIQNTDLFTSVMLHLKMFVQITFNYDFLCRNPTCRMSFLGGTLTLATTSCHVNLFIYIFIFYIFFLLESKTKFLHRRDFFGVIDWVVFFSPTVPNSTTYIILTDHGCEWLCALVSPCHHHCHQPKNI